MSETVIKITGMMCGHCKAAVEKALGGMAGVESAGADLDKGTATVRFDPAIVSTEELRAAVEDLGYDAAL